MKNYLEIKIETLSNKKTQDLSFIKIGLIFVVWFIINIIIFLDNNSLYFSLVANASVLTSFLLFFISLAISYIYTLNLLFSSLFLILQTLLIICFYIFIKFFNFQKINN